MNTYLLYCRFQKMRGGFTEAEYEREIALVRETLAPSTSRTGSEYLAAAWGPADPRRRAGMAAGRAETSAGIIGAMTANEGWLEVESLDLEAQGVAPRRRQGGVHRGALPGEEVQVQGAPPQEQLGAGHAGRAAAARARSACVPRCPHFGVCGGCKMQHLHVGAQVAIKQRVLEDALWHLGKVRPEMVLRRSRARPGATAGARLSVRHVRRRARCWSASTSASRATWPTSASCEVLPPHVSGCCCRCAS